MGGSFQGGKGDKKSEDIFSGILRREPRHGFLGEGGNLVKVHIKNLPEPAICQPMSCICEVLCSRFYLQLLVSYPLATASHCCKTGGGATYSLIVNSWLLKSTVLDYFVALCLRNSRTFVPWHSSRYTCMSCAIILETRLSAKLWTDLEQTLATGTYVIQA